MATDPFKKLKSTQRLPSPPGVALRLLELVKDDNASFDDLARVIGTDPALSARILKYVNSPLVSLGFHGSSLEEAVARIGMRGAQMVALSFSLVSREGRPDCPAFDFEAFWAHSLGCAVSARCLARSRGAWDPEGAFMTGLLLHIGRLAYACAMPEEYEPVAAGREHPELKLPERERAVLGADHFAFGAQLLREWQLPEEIWGLIAAFTDLDGDPSAPNERVRVLSLADRMASLLTDGVDGCVQAFVDADLLAQGELGVAPGELSGRLTEAARDWSAYGRLLEIPTGRPPDFSEMEAQAGELRDVLRVASEIEIRTLRAENEHLVDLANRDRLTGALNRGAFDKALSAALEQAQAEEKAVALMMIDVDHFKSVNDTHGHPAGDSVLRHVAKVLSDAARKRDEVYRYGGEEFAIIAHDLPHDAARCLAEAFRTAVAAAPIKEGDRTIRVTVSIGVAWAQWPDRPLAPGTLIECSDQRLYEAKRGGRNRCCLHPMADAAPVPVRRGFLTRIGRALAGSAR